MPIRKKPKFLPPDAPLYHADHRRPVTRRDMIRQGFMAGMGAAFVPSAMSLFSSPVQAAVAQDVAEIVDGCTLGAESLRKVPFICFDLAGGANISGSNVIVGGVGGPRDVLTTAGYSKLGLPAEMIPSEGGDNINSSLGLDFHADSAMLTGILGSFTTNIANTNGIVIPARSDNDTGNNPHNPMYQIARYTMAGEAGFDETNMVPWGQLMALVGSRNSVSGGNSLSRTSSMVTALQPTKVDRPSDARGLINTGSLMSLFNNDTAVAAQVLESMARMSKDKLALERMRFYTDNAANENLKDLISCGYVKAADIAASFDSPDVLDPELDPDIVGDDGIFTEAEFNGDSEFRKTASVMKLVIEGRAGAGTITMGGYDYHTGDRTTGELRDIRAGRCIGACLEYAARKGVPLMVYVFSDGSVASNGMVDSTGKGVWIGDNSSTAASFSLVYDPTGRPSLLNNSSQIGYMRRDASVDTGSSRAANNVNNLVDTVVLNYMALHGDEGQFTNLFGTSLGNNATEIDRSLRLQTLGYEFT